MNTVNKEISTYLIQRGIIEQRDFKSGIDSLVKFDYMGSVEFEFGALPNSLKVIRESINDYTYMDVPMGKDKVVTVFCNESIKSFISSYLRTLSENKMYLKEYSAFDVYVNDKKDFNRGVNFWWDIENHIMFWVKNPAFEQSFKEKIQPSL